MTNKKRDNKKGAKPKYNGKEKTTLYRPQSSSVGINSDEMEAIKSYGYQALIYDYENIKKDIKYLKQDNEKINKRLEKNTKTDNRLLNRFGWTLIMANILLGAFALVIVVISVEFLYPFLENALNNHQGQFWTILIILELILIGIVSLWWEVTKFAKYIKERDQITEK